MTNLIAKIFSKNGTEEKTITSDQVVLEALCAYRDQLIQSDDWQTLEVQSKLSILAAEISDVADRFHK